MLINIAFMQVDPAVGSQWLAGLIIRQSLGMDGRTRTNDLCPTVPLVVTSCQLYGIGDLIS